MGTYGVSENELIEKLSDCLDNIEGDFNKLDLFNALEFMKRYAPTSDTTKVAERNWHKELKARGLE